MVLPERKTFIFGISDSPNINKVQLLFELFLLEYVFSNYLLSPFALQEKNQKLHCNHHQKLCFYFTIIFLSHCQEHCQEFHQGQ